MWETRRANALLRACADLQQGIADQDHLQRAAAVVSEYVAARAPEGVVSLPRGYAIAPNAEGARSLAFNGTFFDPFYSDPQPDRALLLLLGAHLKSGLLVEIEKCCGENRK